MSVIRLAVFLCCIKAAIDTAWCRFYDTHIVGANQLWQGGWVKAIKDVSRSGLVFGSRGCLCVLSLLACLGTPGCLSVSREMTPENVATVGKFNKSVCVKVVSACEPLPGSHTRANAIQSALCTALQNNGPFSKIVESGASDYVLEVKDITIVDAAFSNSMTPYKPLFSADWADAESVWTIKEANTGKVVWTKRVVGDFSAGSFDTPFSWLGIVRARRANTKAVSKYIEKGITEISGLTL